jgi:hypothetical protein
MMNPNKVQIQMDGMKTLGKDCPRTTSIPPEMNEYAKKGSDNTISGFSPRAPNTLP